MRIPALDGVRALAILLVIPHNVDMLSGPLTPSEYPAVLLFHSGWVGVQLFFVLSGFLITGNLLDTRGSRNYFGAFFARRALRILPLYFAVLIVAFVIAPLLFARPAALIESAPKQIWLWTFLSNWTIPYDGGVYGFQHFWSLAVEEQFYLLWPLVVLWCAPPRLVRVCIATILGTVLVRLAMESYGSPPEALYMLTPCRADALACGAAGAALLRIPASKTWLDRSGAALAWGAIAMLIIATLTTHGYAIYNQGSQALGYTFIAFAFTLILLLAVGPRRGIVAALLHPLSSRALGVVGRYSYAMYVFHLPLHMFIGLPLLHRYVATITPPLAVLYAAAVTLTSFAAAALSYELFERHFLHLKGRIAYKSVTPTAA